MKKLKLVMSIATMCLAIAVLCFGVLAATSVTYTIQGTISYDVEDVYVDVNTTVYKSAKYLSGAQQNELLESLGNPANLSSAKTTYGLTETGDSNSFSTLNTESPSNFSGLTFAFNKDVKTYAIVVNVKNLTDKNAWAVVDSRTSTSTNVTIVDNYQLNIAKDGTGKNVIILVTPTDVTQPIASGTFTFSLVFGSDEYVNSATNMSKMTISGNSVTAKDSNISGVLVIPSSVTSIGSSSFEWCEKLTSITIPNSVTSIGYSAFYWCVGLTSVIFEEESKLNTIEYEAFLHCSGLTSITIPSSVTSIGIDAFSDCYELNSVIFEEGSRLTSISNNLFYICPKLTYIEIPSSVTSIGSYAFEECSSLTNIEIPSSVTSIGSGAFSSTPWLNNLTTDSNGLKIVTSSDNANVKFLLGYTGTISEITAEMLSGVKVICDSAFSGCSSLTSITIPSGVISIGSEAFSWCNVLTSITIPEGVTSIGQNAFYGCSNLTSIEIPSSVTSIGSCAFDDTPWLANLTADSNGLKIVTSSDKANVKFLLGYTGTISEITAKMLSGVQVIYKEVFYNNTTLQSITIPSTLTSIGESTFFGCSQLNNVTFEEGSQLTSIGSNAFRECSSLTSITIPSSVTSIGRVAFSNSGLTTATFDDPNGWKAGSTSLTLTNTSTNATYLKSAYSGESWTKTA